VLFLLAILSQISEGLQPYFQKLLELSLRSGADVSAVTTHSTRPWSLDTGQNRTGEGGRIFFATHNLNPVTDWPLTAAGALITATDYGFDEGLEIVPRLYHLIAAYGLDEQIGDLSHWEINDERSNVYHVDVRRRLQIRESLMRVPDLAESKSSYLCP
jgi:hypothetical protein